MTVEPRFVRAILVDQSGSIITPASMSNQTTEIGILNSIDESQDTALAILNDIDNKLLVVANPPYLDKSANQIRAQVTGSLTTAGTVSTVTTVTGLTNVDGYQGKLIAINNNTTAWALACRARLS